MNIKLKNTLNSSIIPFLSEYRNTTQIEKFFIFYTNFFQSFLLIFAESGHNFFKLFLLLFLLLRMVSVEMKSLFSTTTRMKLTLRLSPFLVFEWNFFSLFCYVVCDCLFLIFRYFLFHRRINLLRYSFSRGFSSLHGQFMRQQKKRKETLSSRFQGFNVELLWA
jgi:hypothetical protein